MIRKTTPPKVRHASYTHQCGPVRESAAGDRYGIEYVVDVYYTLTPGRRATWSEWDGGTPEEPPEVDIVRAELASVVIYAPPSYQTGVEMDDREPNWRAFKREAEGWLLDEIRDDFEAWILSRT